MAERIADALSEALGPPADGGPLSALVARRTFWLTARAAPVSETRFDVNWTLVAADRPSMEPARFTTTSEAAGWSAVDDAALSALADDAALRLRLSPLAAVSLERRNATPPDTPPTEPLEIP